MFVSFVALIARKSEIFGLFGLDFVTSSNIVVEPQVILTFEGFGTPFTFVIPGSIMRFLNVPGEYFVVFEDFCTNVAFHGVPFVGLEQVKFE